MNDAKGLVFFDLPEQENYHFCLGVKARFIDRRFRPAVQPVVQQAGHSVASEEAGRTCSLHDFMVFRAGSAAELFVCVILRNLVTESADLRKVLTL